MLKLEKHFGTILKHHFDFQSKLFDMQMDKDQIEYKIGDRVAQFMIAPVLSINFLEVVNLPKSDRDLGAFGSSGN